MESGSDIEIAPGVRVPASALEFTFLTSRGPGGQNVNRRATRARLRLRLDAIPLDDAARGRLAAIASHLITEAGDLIISVEEERSRERNRARCLERLRELIVLAQVRPKKRRATRPTRGSVERRLQSKRERSDTKRRRQRPDQD